MAVFAMLGTLMFCSKLLMELLPNIHLLGMFTVLFTVVFRAKALIPIYINVFLTGLYGGFNLWWVPYLYLWLILWGVAMLLPRQMPRRVAAVVYPAICALHGLLYGTLYAPAQALMFGLDFRAMLAWIATGIPFDLLHAVANLATGLLILPLAELLRRILKIKQ
ncbi:MAG: hypothetical protein IJW71_00625 [Clostridia bacterium]|nr:hypothetical protein [Clostridia bacterium]